jgi:hypothetical protein
MTNVFSNADKFDRFRNPWQQPVWELRVTLDSPEERAFRDETGY